MTSKIYLLSNRQASILRLLAQGKTYLEVIHLLGISPANLHTVVSVIRKKTGIQNTKNPQECKDWLRGRHGHPFDAPTYSRWPKTPTRTQLEMMTLHAQGLTYAQIAQQCAVTHQTVQNAVSQGCKRARIVNVGLREERTAAIRSYLEGAGLIVEPVPDPLDEF